MAFASASSQAAAALLLASSLGLSLRADWLEAARATTAAAGGGNWSSSSSSPMTAEALVSLVLNADLNSAGAGGSLPADLEVRIEEDERKRETRGREREERVRGDSSRSSSLLSARGNRKKKLTSETSTKK